MSVGAGHEHGLRPGTENVAYIVGLGRAARLARLNLSENPAQLRDRRDLLHGLLCAAIPGLALNGHPESRLPNTLNLSFPDVSGHGLLEAAAADIAASTGSACHADNQAASGVLGAMGLSAGRAMGAVRLSVGHYTTPADVERAAAALIEAWRELQS